MEKQSYEKYRGTVNEPRTWTIRFNAKDATDFEHIVSGRKLVETRAATPKYRRVAAGDRLRIVCGDQEITKTVRRVTLYPTPHRLLAAEGLENVNPDWQGVDQAIEKYASFPSYREKIAAHGLVAWELG